MRQILLSLLLVLGLQTAEAQFFTLRPQPRKSFRIISRTSSDSVRSSDLTAGKSIDSVSVPPSRPAQQDSSSSPSVGFSSPLSRKLVINSRFGSRIDPFTKKHRFHHGVDLHSRADAVLSMLSGRVKKTGYDKKGYGNYVTMTYGDFEVTYAHLSSIFVSAKDLVQAGAPVGVSGSSGRSTGEHLHITLKHRGKSVDPLPFLLFIDKRASAPLDPNII